MKVKRLKHVRKIMNFYKVNFGFNAPYAMLVDGTFCKSALTFQINIREQMPKYMESEVNLYTTSCCLAECESFGTLMYGPLKILHQFEVKPCFHKKPVPAGKCMIKVARKAKTYLVGTQDNDLREEARKTGGIPLVFMSHNAINVENPSEKSKKKAGKKLNERLGATGYQLEALKQLKKQEFGEETEVKRKKKKRKGPNPLSCKKKKQQPTQNNPISDNKKIRKKRKRLKVSSDMKIFLKSVGSSVMS